MTLTPLFKLTIDSLNEDAISSTLESLNGPNCLSLYAYETSVVEMNPSVKYGPYTTYVKTDYPNDPTTYPGGQIKVILSNQQCGPPYNKYQTIVYVDFDDNNVLEKAWAFNISMTPATRGGGQFATFNAAFGSSTTTPNATEILKIALEKGAQMRIVKKGIVNTWSYKNGACFEVDFNVQSS